MFFNKRYLSSLFVTFQLLSGREYVHAVCNNGELAVGTESLFEIDSASHSTITSFAGFLMANDCGLISQNGATENSNQLCEGDYDDGASVTCVNNFPVEAVDTQGAQWTCFPTSDTSCNIDSGFGSFNVLVCCNRG